MPEPGPSWSISPEQWQAQVDYDSWDDRYTPDDSIGLHHGGGGDYRAGNAPYSMAQEMSQLRSWESLHLGKGWKGLAYGWGFGLSGAVYRIRGWGTYGAHTGDRDGDGISNNTEVIPFLMIASGNNHIMTPEADASIKRMRRYVEAESGRKLTLYGHQELRGTATTCPGPNYMDYVRANRILQEEEMTPEQEKAVNWLIEALASKSTDPIPWGKAAWSRYIKWWSGAPGPSSPVSHLQLAHIADQLQTAINNVQAGTGTIDTEARAMLAAIHEATNKE